MGKIKSLKNIHVEFGAADGTQKSAECLPNGYYIIPVVERDSPFLKVKGPAGWHFAPQKIPIHVHAGETCTHNFELTGFSLSGSISAEGCKAVPEGVSVSLIDGSGKVTAQTTAKSGSYSFQNVFPGKYTIKATHATSSWKKDSIEVQFEWDNVVVQDQLVISGFALSGVVVDSEESVGVAGVSFFLYSLDDAKFTCEQTNVDQVTGTKPNCGVVSGSDGKFLFQGVPCGNYEIVPSYTDKSTTFDVVPKKLPVTVDSAPMKPHSFQVKGFSMRGRVLGLNREGLPGVTISLEGRTFVTDAQGNYQLDQLVSGEHTLTASLPHYQFNKLENVKVTPQQSTVPDFVATKVDICGQVSIPKPPPGVSAGNRKIQLAGARNENFQTDGSGKFCVSVDPGKYMLVPQVSDAETKAGLVFPDSEVVVTVVANPVLDINFEQTRLVVSGRVKCLVSPCDHSISVSLVAVGAQKDRVTTGLEDLVQGDQAEDGYFVFNDVLPRKYYVSIQHTNWCWDAEKTEEFELKTKDHTHITFTQTGFLMVAQASHDIEVISIPSKNPNQQKTLQLKSGENKFCFPDADKYTLSPNSCFQFEAPNFVYDSTQPTVIHFKAQKYLLAGQILVEDMSPNSNVELFATSSKDSQKIKIIPTLVETKEKHHLFNYSYHAGLKETVTLTPISNDLFFYPQNIVTTVEHNGCLPLLPITKARRGLFLSGSISPVVSQAKVSVFFKSDKSIALDPVYTDEKGIYRVGPLYDEKEYFLTVEKNGYVITQTGDSTWNAAKLASINVDIGGLGGVFISLSGSDAYTSSFLSEEKSHAQFLGVAPGDYFIKPVLTEYTFDPQAQKVTISEGEDKIVKFTTKRVAFSCFGRVRMLDGQPARGVTVVATSKSGTENAKTDSTGAYRIRGLVPGESYSVAVKLGNEAIKLERFEPAVHKLVTADQDLTNVDFLAFLKSEKTEIVGHVNTTKELLSTLTLKVTKGTETVDEFHLGPNNVFIVPDLDVDSEYVFELRSTLSTKDHQFSLPSKTIKIGQINEPLKFDFNSSSKRTMEHDIDNSPFLGPIVVIGLIIATYYRNELKKWYLSFFKKGGDAGDSWNSVHNSKKRN